MRMNESPTDLLDEEIALARNLEQLWRAAEPPPHFADRVTAAWAIERAARPPLALEPRRRWLAIGGSLAAAGLLVALTGAGLGLSWPSTGAVRAAERSELVIGSRATAVAEGGAALSWRVNLRGSVQVEQAAGDVFYRVERGGPFRVQTPAGLVTVRGTCFRVNVRAPGATASGAGRESPAPGVEVAVYEGAVELSNPGGALVLRAGEQARTAAGGSPLRVELAAHPAPSGQRTAGERQQLMARLDSVDARLAAASAQPAAAVALDLAAVRSELAQVKQELAAERELRQAVEGQASDFPPNLDARYRESAITRNFQEALKRSGLAGEITAVDCSEYPCLVYGELRAGAAESGFDESLKNLTGQLEQTYPESESGMRVMAARKKSKARDGEAEASRNLFGIAVMPKTGDATGEVDPTLGRRLTYRYNQFLEATFGP